MICALHFTRHKIIKYIIFLSITKELGITKNPKITNPLSLSQWVCYFIEFVKTNKSQNKQKVFLYYFHPFQQLVYRF